jgi:hypothetical protein
MDAAVGVLGIVGFAMQALKAIQALQGFCAAYKDARKDQDDFLHDLQASADILTDVLELCKRVEKLDTVSPDDLRTASLSVQVEDCAKDLEEWRRLADSTSEKPKGRLLERSDGNPVIIRSIWARFMTAMNKQNRKTFRERLYWHQHHISTTLAIFGRRFDLASLECARNVKRATSAIQESLVESAHHVITRLDDMSSSNSSLHAASRSTLEMLRDVKSNVSSELKEMREDMRKDMSLLIEVVSSQSSRSGHSNFMPVPDPANAQETNPKTEAGPWRLSPAGDAHQTLQISSYLSHGSEESYSPSASSQAATSDAEDAEFRTLLGTTKMLLEGLRGLRNPLLAEYIATVQAFRQLEFLGKSAKFLDSGLPVALSDNKIPPVVRRRLRAVARQLLNVRANCQKEGLKAALENADRYLGIDDSSVAVWTAMISTGRRLRLDRLPRSGSALSSDETSVSIQEWMLEVAQSNRAQLRLHREILVDVVSHQASIGTRAGDRSILNVKIGLEQSVRSLEDEAYRRDMLKYWFTDLDVVEMGAGAPSVFAASDADSEATIITAAWEDGADEVPSSPVLDAEHAMMSGISSQLCPCPKLPDDLCMDLAAGISLSHGGVPAGKIAASAEVLKCYREEDSCVDAAEVWSYGK